MSPAPERPHHVINITRACVPPCSAVGAAAVATGIMQCMECFLSHRVRHQPYHFSLFADEIRVPFPDSQKPPDLEPATTASQSQGIHQLLQAEKRANDKLEEAKRRKAKRLRQAKEEVMAETDQYRMQRDQAFWLKHAKTMGSQSNLSREIESQTLRNIKELDGSYSTSMESVINQLLSIVCDVKPEIHSNYRVTNYTSTLLFNKQCLHATSLLWLLFIARDVT
ncbi:V-type proton ATPase subunit G 3 [Camelus ferus]|nr:V-type proton ATPase subunit G 3 [Camelus ferus]